MNTPPSPLQLRRSTRQVQKPTWLKDFDASVQSNGPHNLSFAIIPDSHSSIDSGMNLVMHNNSFEPNYLFFLLQMSFTFMNLALSNKPIKTLDGFKQCKRSWMHWNQMVHGN